MYQLLYKYLIINKEVSVPGIGVFVLEREPAKLDMEKRVIHAPQTVIKLRSQSTDTDHRFYNFLAAELNTNVADATEKFNRFAHQLKEEVQHQKWFELPGMGTLTPGVRDEIKFKSAGVVKEYYPSIAIEKISRTQVEEPAVATMPEPEPVVIADDSEEVLLEEPRKRKDLWWIFAIILTLIGVGAIVYYYMYYQPLQY